MCTKAVAARYKKCNIAAAIKPSNVAPDLTRNHVAFFAVLVDVEPLPLDFGGDAQTDHGFDYAADDCGCGDCKHNRDPDRFQLFEPKHMADNFCQTILRGDIC